MATSNKLRALNRLPYDFEDGLKIAGVDVSALTTSTGSGVVGHDGTTVKTVLDTVMPITDYNELRDYTGTATQIRITDPGIEGFFYYDPLDTTSTDNGGTIIVAGTKRWKRHYDGAVSVKWFGAKGDGVTNDTAAIQKAVNVGGDVYFPAGIYLIYSTIKVTSSSVVLRGDVRGRSVIAANGSFAGTGDYVLATMIQFNNFPSTDKLFTCGIRDITLTSAIAALQNPSVACIVHANWMHHFNIDRVRFIGAYGNGSNGTGLILTSKANTGATWAMFNTVTDSDFTYCVNGVLWGASGQGDVNAGQIYRCRFGGGGYGGIGVKVQSGYANSFTDNDVEGFNTGFVLNERVNYLRGNLAEQNTLDYTATGEPGPQLMGNEFNIVRSDAPGNHINDHGTLKNIFIEVTAQSMIVDSNFNSKLYESTFLGTTLLNAGTGESGKHVLTMQGGAAVTDRSRLMVNTKGRQLDGWYTFVIRAKASSVGAGLYLKLPSGGHNSYRFCEIKTGTSDYLELLEANSHAFVSGIGRSGTLATDYRVYYGSVYLSNSIIQADALRLAVQGNGITVTVDYVGMFQGLNAARPTDSMVWETYLDVSSLTTGTSAQIVQLPYPVSVQLIVTGILDGAVQRSINAYPHRVQNGVAVNKVFWSNLNTFGYDSVTSATSMDYLYGPNNSQLIYFSRSTLTGTLPFYLRLEFV